jgi:hypothetical protein
MVLRIHTSEKANKNRFFSDKWIQHGFWIELLDRFKRIGPSIQGICNNTRAATIRSPTVHFTPTCGNRGEIENQQSSEA